MEIIPFHKRQSSSVASFDQIEGMAKELEELSNKKDFKGIYLSCFALHHSQVSEQPFNFFTLSKTGGKNFQSWCIVNPKIISKDKETKFSAREGCMSFPNRPLSKVFRFNSIKVSFQYPKGFYNRKLMSVEKTLTGIAAQIFQHEYDHSIGKSIYD